jgi:SAM-dependent methyltransferase
MTDNNTLDVHRAAYTAAFAHFEENRIVHEAYGRRIAQRIAERGAQRVLSLGIGHTEVARPIVDLLRRRGIASYTIVDAAPAIIEGFRADVAPLPNGLTLVEAWFERVEFDTPFDLVEAGFILEHVDDPALVLRRLHAFLAPGALVCVAVPNARSLHRVLGHEAGLLPDLYALSAADRALGHQRYFDVPRLEALATDCGFRVERRAGLLLKPFTTGQLAKLELTPAVWQALQRTAEPYPEISNAFCMELAACA